MNLSVNLFDSICIIIIFFLTIYYFRNKTNIIFYIIYFILLGFIILRINNNYIEKFNQLPLNTFYPNDKHCVELNDNKCYYPALSNKLDKKNLKKNYENFSSSTLDIYYPEEPCHGNNCNYPSYNNNLHTFNKTHNKKYENIFNGTWINNDKTDKKIYNFLQRNNILLLSIDNNKVEYNNTFNSENWTLIANSPTPILNGQKNGLEDIAIANNKIYGLNALYIENVGSRVNITNMNGGEWSYLQNSKNEKINGTFLNQIIIDNNMLWGIGHNGNSIWSTNLDNDNQFYLRTDYSKQIINFTIYKNIIYIVSNDNYIYKWINSKWNLIDNSCCVTQIHFYNNILYGLGLSKNIYIFENNKFNVLIKDKNILYFKIYNNIIYYISSDYKIYSFDLINHKITNISKGDIYRFEIKDDIIYGIGTDRNLYAINLYHDITKKSKYNVKQFKFNLNHNRDTFYKFDDNFDLIKNDKYILGGNLIYDKKNKNYNIILKENNEITLKLNKIDFINKNNKSNILNNGFTKSTTQFYNNSVYFKNQVKLKKDNNNIIENYDNSNRECIGGSKCEGPGCPDIGPCDINMNDSNNECDANDCKKYVKCPENKICNTQLVGDKNNPICRNFCEPKSPQIIDEPVSHELKNITLNKNNLSQTLINYINNALNNIDIVIYTGYCKGLPETIDEANQKGGRNITSTFKKAIINEINNGASIQTISCSNNFKKNCNINNYSGSPQWWDNTSIGLGPEICNGQYQYLLVKLKDNNLIRINWGSKINLFDFLPKRCPTFDEFKKFPNDNVFWNHDKNICDKTNCGLGEGRSEGIQDPYNPVLPNGKKINIPKDMPWCWNKFNEFEINRLINSKFGESNGDCKNSDDCLNINDNCINELNKCLSQKDCNSYNLINNTNYNCNNYSKRSPLKNFNKLINNNNNNKVNLMTVVNNTIYISVINELNGENIYSIYKTSLNNSIKWDNLYNSFKNFNQLIANNNDNNILIRINGRIYNIDKNKLTDNFNSKYYFYNYCLIKNKQLYGIGKNNIIIYRVKLKNDNNFQPIFTIKSNNNSITMNQFDLDLTNNLIYFIGNDYNIYIGNIINNTFKKLTSCCFTQIKLNNNNIFSLGFESKAIWRIGNNGERLQISEGSISQFEIYNNIIIGIGNDNNLYSAKLNNKSNCCSKWQQTLGCVGKGQFDLNSDFLKSSTGGKHGCDVFIPSGASGFCECIDGKRFYYDCGHEGFKCEDICKNNNNCNITLPDMPFNLKAPEPPINNLKMSNNNYILNSSTFNNIFNTDNLCVFDFNDKKNYSVIFIDPNNYSTLGVNLNHKELEMNNNTPLSKLFKNNFKISMKLATLNNMYNDSNNNILDENNRKIYNVIRYMIENNLSCFENNKHFDLSNSDKEKIKEIFDKINYKFKNIDIDNSEFLNNVKNELNNPVNENVSVFNIKPINNNQNSCDTLIDFQINNANYNLIPNNNGSIDLSLTNKASKNRIYRFENLHNYNSKTDVIANYFKNILNLSIYKKFDCYIRSNDGRYLNNSKHNISGEPFTWTVIIFDNNKTIVKNKISNM